MFYAGTRDLNISSTLQKNISVGVFGGEGLFQTQVKGSGVVVLYSPVLANEVQKIELDNQKYDYLLLKSGIYCRFHSRE